MAAMRRCPWVSGARWMAHTSLTRCSRETMSVRGRTMVGRCISDVAAPMMGLRRCTFIFGTKACIWVTMAGATTDSPVGGSVVALAGRQFGRGILAEGWNRTFRQREVGKSWTKTTNLWNSLCCSME